MDLKLNLPPDLDVDQTNYYWFKEGFNLNEVKAIESLTNTFPYQTATTVGNPDESLDSVRKSKIKWLHHDSKTDWVYDKLLNMVIEANTMWKFNLHSIIDSIQYTEYYEGGGHYDWHVDIGPKDISHRKISITIQLSDSDEYEGGDLELWTGGAKKVMPRGKGISAFFPSFMMHRVTPITKGIRKSLVLWVGGEHYK